MRMSYILLAVVALGCGGGGGASGYSTAPPTGNGTGAGTTTGSASVAVQSTDDGYGYQTFAFSPSTVTITKGGTVTWNNGGTTRAQRDVHDRRSAHEYRELHVGLEQPDVPDGGDILLSLHEPRGDERDGDGSVRRRGGQPRFDGGWPLIFTIYLTKAAI